MVLEYYHKCVYVVTEWNLKKKEKKNFFFFWIWEFLSQIWEKHLIFALGIGAEIRPQNRPRKIPVKRVGELGKKGKRRQDWRKDKTSGLKSALFACRRTLKSALFACRRALKVPFSWELLPCPFLGLGETLGGQGGCEWGMEVFVKIQKKNIFFFGGGGGGGWVWGGGGSGRGGSGWMWTKNWSFCENSKKKLGGGGVNKKFETICHSIFWIISLVNYFCSQKILN